MEEVCQGACALVIRGQGKWKVEGGARSTLQEGGEKGRGREERGVGVGLGWSGGAFNMTWLAQSRLHQ